MAGLKVEWNKSEDLYVEIKSQNLMGMSSNANSIRIRKPIDNFETFMFIKSLLLKDSSSIEVFWKQVQNHSKIESYTIFWCGGLIDNQCNVSICFQAFFSLL